MKGYKVCFIVWQKQVVKLNNQKTVSEQSTATYEPFFLHIIQWKTKNISSR